jgi:rhamnosyl/mannosyltransferase
LPRPNGLFYYLTIETGPKLTAYFDRLTTKRLQRVKMKILHIYKTYYPEDRGGISRVISQLANNGEDFGFKSEVFTFSKNPSPQIITFEKHRVTRTKTNITLASTPMSFSALKLFRKKVEECDIVHYHYPYPFGDFLKLFCARNKPSVVTYHSDIVKQRYLKYLYFPLEKWFLKSATAIVYTSPNIRETSKNLRLHKEKSSLICLGLAQHSLVGKKEAENSRLFEDLSRPFVLFVGYLRTYKGIDVLLEAADKVNCDLVIAGDGESIEEYRRKVRTDKLNNVHLVGPVTEREKKTLILKSSGVVLPSITPNEAFGVILLEAAMQKKPLISTELGTGTSFVNKHEITGLVVSPNCINELASAINFIIENPKDAQRMGEEARKRYLRYFTAEPMCREYARVYRHILDIPQ